MNMSAYYYTDTLSFQDLLDNKETLKDRKVEIEKIDELNNGEKMKNNLKVITDNTITEKDFYDGIRILKGCQNDWINSFWKYYETLRWFFIEYKSFYDSENSQYQKDICKELGWSESRFSKWKSICLSDYVFENTETLPPTLNSLYYITNQINSNNEDLVKKFKWLPTLTTSQIKEKFEKLIETKKSNKKNDQSEEFDRTENLVDDNEDNSQSIKELIKNEEVFKTFFFEPNNEFIQKYGTEEWLSSYINNEIPIGELRGHTQRGPNTLLIKIPFKHIQLGFKLIESWGFKYYQSFIPNQPYEELVNFDETIVLMGVNGRCQLDKEEFLSTDNNEDIFEFCETHFPKPYTNIFGNTKRKGWVCLKN
jgi:hypothetical protein